jgi:hypothetical protein
MIHLQINTVLGYKIPEISIQQYQLYSLLYQLGIVFAYLEFQPKEGGGGRVMQIPI